MKVAIDYDEHHGIEVELILLYAQSLAAKVNSVAFNKQVDQSQCGNKLQKENCFTLFVDCS